MSLDISGSGPDSNLSTMMDQKPNRLFGRSPLTTVVMVIYFGAGYGLIKNFWPDTDIGAWILIAVGMVGYIFVLWRQQNRG